MIQFGDADVMVADQELCRLSIVHHSKKLHGLLIVDRGRLSGYSIAGETLKSSPTTVFLAIISSDFLVINNRKLSMQKNVEQKFMLSFVDMECDAHHITQPPEDGKGAILAMSVALRHVN
ncbi:hypothetical protein Bca52824_087195 [Brassica carinata]|uniref:Uncharacterized protein n=1 Tax=Brassica carinata TaxID=52824 RepID=A0A8X7PAV9_BRACI|nr:hypothetical protein Bca52824_087195 [Brassica carinata]